MAKTAAYGISSVTLANPGANGAYPSSWTGIGTFSFKAIVKDSFQFSDSESSDNDIEVEDSDEIYASLQSSAPTKGFTMDTYDLSEEAYIALQQFTEVIQGEGESAETWYAAPAKSTDLIKAVQVVNQKFDEFPSKTFQWAKMLIKVTRAGTLGKSGFPNFHLTFKEQMNANAKGEPISGHRWKLSPTTT